MWRLMTLLIISSSFSLSTICVPALLDFSVVCFRVDSRLVAARSILADPSLPSQSGIFTGLSPFNCALDCHKGIGFPAHPFGCWKLYRTGRCFRIVFLDVFSLVMWCIPGLKVLAAFLFLSPFMVYRVCVWPCSRGLCGRVVKVFALKLLAPLHFGSGSNPMRGSCQLLTEGCWFTPRINLFFQLWKLICHIYQNKVEKWRITPIHITSPDQGNEKYKAGRT